MIYRDTALFGAIAALGLTLVPVGDALARAAQAAPNIVLIMLDDVGFADASTFGGLAQMPTLDRLAKEGLRYNRFHTTSVCSTTRAALLTGRNHHRVGYGAFGGVGYPGYDGLWKKSTVSVAEILRRNGYSTAVFGKWHNTPYQDVSPVGPFDRWPTGLGFEYFYGNLLGESSQWEPPLWRNTEMAPPPARPQQGYHFTTDIADEAIRWVRTHESLAPERPYFLYFATEGAHIPHHVPKEWIDRYRGRFDRGWDELRLQVLAQQKSLGVVPASATLTPRPSFVPAWDSLSVDQRRLFARQMEVYAAFLSHTDHQIGRLLDAVREGPRADNTLVLFIVGDNGAMALTDPRSAEYPLRDLNELGGLSSPLITRHADGWSWVNYAAGWAWLGNTPFPRAKGAASHLGGTRNPLVAWWPARIKDPGGVRTRFGHVIDIAPTLYEAAGIEFPSHIDGVKQQPLDGASFFDTFGDADAAEPHRVQYFEFGGLRAIYRDGWLASAVPSYQGAASQHDFTRDRWELYDLATDFSQARNVANKHPARVQELQSLFDAEARRNNVYPLGAGTLVRGLEGTAHKRKLVFPGSLPTLFRFPGSQTGPGYDLWDFSRPFSVTADVIIPATGASGVLLAWGSRYGGMTLYAKNNRLVYENNIDGKRHEILSCDEPLPHGRASLKFELGRDASHPPGRTVGRLYIDKRLVSEKPLSGGATHFFDGVFDIGRNSVSPVSDAYSPPFSFNGVLESITVELQPAEGPAEPD